MNTIQVIYFITISTWKNIVILDEGDRTPLQAIERLACNFEDEKNIRWKMNGTLEKDTLLIYQ